MIYQYSHRLFRRIAAFLAVLTLAGAPLQTTAADHPHKISIAQARTLPPGTVVTVDGSVTTPSGAFESSFFDKGFALQDRTAGIYVSLRPTSASRSCAGRESPARSRRLRSAHSRAGRSRRRPSLGHGPPGAAANFGADQPRSARRPKGGSSRVSRPSPSACRPTAVRLQALVDDGSGEVQIFVNIQTGSTVPGLSVGQLVSVTGFSSQFDTHYEIDPRIPADIVVATSP